MPKSKSLSLSISTEDGRIFTDDKVVATRVSLGEIPKEKDYLEVDLQLVLKRSEAEAIYNALATGKIFLEINDAKTTEDS